ncbi:hypothetical protein [Streptomyces silvisoli]|uniref:Lipoprotein n=1 Tax=Streptomyces silvisoli TaxID=3034235 RepID=A0ABT5ZX54_9ACTN|nr:hypothetical protein [Streptomyces silvisoli]MDF3294341.1 hypothetical protein [Streptomyces silvisoli]
MAGAVRVGRAVAVAAGVIAMLGSCSASDRSATASVPEIVGQWSDSKGATISFAANRTFESRGLVINNSTIKNCPSGPAMGVWAFMPDHGSGGQMDASATSASTIGLSFGHAPAGTCSGFQLDVRKAAKKITLCVTDDPDSPCAVGVRFTKTS